MGVGVLCTYKYTRTGRDVYPWVVLGNRIWNEDLSNRGTPVICLFTSVERSTPISGPYLRSVESHGATKTVTVTTYGYWYEVGKDTDG